MYVVVHEIDTERLQWVLANAVRNIRRGQKNMICSHIISHVLMSGYNDSVSKCDKKLLLLFFGFFFLNESY